MNHQVGVKSLHCVDNCWLTMSVAWRRAAAVSRSASLHQRIAALLHDDSGHVYTNGSAFANGRQVIQRIRPLVEELDHERDAGAELEAAATALLEAQRVAVLTGFPCNLDQPCLYENDGPAGAIAVARALQQLGKDAIILTEAKTIDLIDPLRS